MAGTNRLSVNLMSEELNNLFKLKDNEFICYVCGGTFIKGQTDEEAQKEVEQLFPGVKPEDCESVCNNCNKIFWEWMESKM